MDWWTNAETMSISKEPRLIVRVRFRVVRLLLLFGLLTGNAFCQGYFDVSTYSKDPNGFPLNPGWGWQADAAWQAQQTNTP
jgi:hypothetical protein